MIVITSFISNIHILDTHINDIHKNIFQHFWYLKDKLLIDIISTHLYDLENRLLIKFSLFFVGSQEIISKAIF